MIKESYKKLSSRVTMGFNVFVFLLLIVIFVFGIPEILVFYFTTFFLQPFKNISSRLGLQAWASQTIRDGLLKEKTGNQKKCHPFLKAPKKECQNFKFM